MVKLSEGTEGIPYHQWVGYTPELKSSTTSDRRWCQERSEYMWGTLGCHRPGASVQL